MLTNPLLGKSTKHCQLGQVFFQTRFDSCIQRAQTLMGEPTNNNNVCFFIIASKAN